MKPGLRVGDTQEITVTVDAQSQAKLLGGPIHPLYGTAGMIAHMEWAARQHILPYLEEGEEGVGCEVNVRHLAPAPLGVTVRIQSVVKELPPQRVVSQVRAWWNDVLIGEGTLVQAVVHREKLYACLESVQNDPEAMTAQLTDERGQARFSLRALRWEHDVMACTRYDEWLICMLQADSLQHEGAFLLRYEMEEWQQACLEMVAGQRTEYRSDFLEPVLSVGMQASGPQRVQMSLSILVDGQSVTLNFQVSHHVLEQFATALRQQLEAFPSLL